MTNTLFLIPQLSKLLYCFPLARANIRPRPLVPFFQISLKNSELKTTHDTFRGCRVHFFRQPFSKQLYMLVPVCTTPPTPLPPQKKLDHHHPDGHKYFAGKPERQKYFAYFRFALSVGHLYLFYASIREVALPYKTIVLWFYGGGRGCIHVEIPPVRKGGKGQAVTSVL